MISTIVDVIAARGKNCPAAGFNALFTHRVRVSSLPGVDAELMSWLRGAYDRAG